VENVVGPKRALLKIEEGEFEPPVVPDLIGGVFVEAKTAGCNFGDKRVGKDNGDQRVSKNRF